MERKIKMKIYTFSEGKPVIFDTEDIAEILSLVEGEIEITLKDGFDYPCSKQISAFPELLKDFDLEEATEIGLKGRDVYTGNTGLFECLKKLRNF